MGQPTAEWLRHRFGAEIVWLPFDLHPEYPPEGIPRSELNARYGGSLHDHVLEMFEAAELEYAPPADVVPNSRRALQVTELARELRRHEQIHARVMDAYWSEGQNIGDPAVLISLAAEGGLPEDEVEDVLAGERYLDRIHESTRQAISIGVTGVPAWLLDRRLLVLGAQPREAFEQAFEQLPG